ncbi:adenylate/guanylate cyclase domain-containing protein [Endozoicomonas ascidiicola]|uniref:adenylate/guanylate cyclase domain-containing protein n=1 Tax=Endozoicomonas ascidiicola TaxID=1698521 RepID=UPI00082B40AE|nr:adenylate/guanylate cyclase domain-containing protein [Endozoicomonas ascidiicola]
MQAKNYTPAASLSTTAPIQPRVLAYWIAASVVVYFLANELLPWTFLSLVGYFSIFPWASNKLVNGFIQSENKSVVESRRRITLFMFDSLNTASLITFMNFPLVSSMLIAALMISRAIYLQGAKGFLLLLPAAGLGLAIQQFIDIQTKITKGQDLVFISLLVFTLFSAFLAFVMRDKEKKYQEIQMNAQQQRQRYSKLASNLSKYLPPQVWESIFAGKRNVKLESQRKKLTVFFSDIKGFTDLAEELEPEALTGLLNTYLNDMSRIAMKYGGTIDKFVGDSIMIFFGDPKTKGARKDALAAVSMAIEMQKHMQVLRKQWIGEGIENPLRIRIGINTGFCTVGNFGAEFRMDYTALGRDVNLASRLESSAEPDQILVSHETWSLVKDVVLCQSKDEIQVKGFSRPVPVYRVIDLRRNMGLQKSYLEYDAKGFSLSLDTDDINVFERKKILQKLEEATQKLLKDDIATTANSEH